MKFNCQEKLSDRVGKKRSTIANYLRLVKLDPIIKTGIRDGFVTMGHGRALVNVDSKEDQIDIYEKIVGQSLSVRDTERMVKGFHEKTNALKPASQVKNLDFAIHSKKELSDFLTSKVAVSSSEKGKGKITIPFASEEELLRIKKLILGT